MILQSLLDHVWRLYHCLSPTGSSIEAHNRMQSLQIGLLLAIWALFEHLKDYLLNVSQLVSQGGGQTVTAHHQ